MHDASVLFALDRHLVECDYREKELTEEILDLWRQTLCGKSKTISEKVTSVRMFAKYEKAAKSTHPDKFGSGRYTPHVMRYTAAAHLIEAGVPHAVVKNILGHVSIQTTQIYVEITQQTIDQSIKRWNEKWFPSDEGMEKILPNVQDTFPGFLR